MKHIYRVIILISAFGIIGTIGAFDTNTVTLGQALIQLIFAVISLRTGILCLNMINYKANHNVRCRHRETVTGYTIINVIGGDKSA